MFVDEGFGSLDEDTLSQALKVFTDASNRTSNNWKAPGKTGMKGVTASGAPL
jgi:hypothetical protein